MRGALNGLGRASFMSVTILFTSEYSLDNRRISRLIRTGDAGCLAQPIETRQRSDPSSTGIGGPHLRGHGRTIAKERVARNESDQPQSERRQQRVPVDNQRRKREVFL